MTELFVREHSEGNEEEWRKQLAARRKRPGDAERNVGLQQTPAGQIEVVCRVIGEALPGLGT